MDDSMFNNPLFNGTPSTDATFGVPLHYGTVESSHSSMSSDSFCGTASNSPLLNDSFYRTSFSDSFGQNPSAHYGTPSSNSVFDDSFYGTPNLSRVCPFDGGNVYTSDPNASVSAEPKTITKKIAKSVFEPKDTIIEKIIKVVLIALIVPQAAFWALGILGGVIALLR